MKRGKWFFYSALFTGLGFFLTIGAGAKTTTNDKTLSDTFYYQFSISQHYVKSDKTIPDTYITIGPPEQKWTGIYRHNEKFIIPVVFVRPPDYVNNFKVNIYTYYTRDLIKSFQVNPVWQENQPFTYQADLSGFPDGIYRFQVKEEEGLTPFISVEGLIARKPAETSAVSIEIPADIPSCHDLISSETHLVLFTPVINSMNGRKRWNAIINFMDWAHHNSKEMEFRIPWALIEPLPGVYNFSEVDRILTFARRRGFKASLWLDLSFLPKWLNVSNFDSGIFEMFPPQLKSHLMSTLKHFAEKSVIKRFVEESASQSAFQYYFFSFARKTGINKFKMVKSNVSAFNVGIINYHEMANFKLKKDRIYKSAIETVRNIDKKRLIVVYGTFDSGVSIWMNNHGVMHGRSTP